MIGCELKKFPCCVNNLVVSYRQFFSSSFDVSLLGAFLKTRVQVSRGYIIISVFNFKVKKIIIANSQLYSRK